jgi:hypothetical protein
MINKRDSLGRIAKGNGFKTGLSDDPIYDCWVAMKARCLNSQHPMYKHYGARGITVCNQWISSFETFLHDMGSKPTVKHTLDRINVNGNYEPGNCRWATIQEQQKNRRDNNAYVGVVYEPARKKYRADITFEGRKYFLGRFKYLQEAIHARKQAELYHSNALYCHNSY